jgi:hypothetical protein
MQLLDLRGRIVRSAAPTGSTVEIDLKGLSKGAYIVRCGMEALVVGLAD